MTKCIVLEERTKRETKRIEFEYILDTSGETGNEFFEFTADDPENYANIELVKKGFEGGFDIIFAYNEYRTQGNLYLGYWNDGIVCDIENKSNLRPVK